ncbi:Crp/Fnr family transcriptional regulator [Christiangramia crocea]|uniref:Crp/Fnr family transcriptional regulator n=1 Tax=Christiangramia crocea TaxID=2904124 RepID=A0A9X1UZE3_9FLAO|nr:Crp/Fnr family transcriptional regulator [Gramella crocea]MCG9972379.1 Crp/Fnr family transcriptional regulator [Gramella crocea]
MKPIVREYLDTLSGLSPLSPQTRELLLNCISTRTISKGELLLEHGEVCKHIYYVDKGLMRIFYYKDKRDITEWFAGDKQFLFSVRSYFEETPSKLIIEALEDSEVILLSKEKQEVLIKTNLEVANLMIKAFSYSLILSQKRMESIQFESAKERYVSLMEQQPEIIHKAPLQYIASFLGITQETLSRIRSKI